MKLSSKIRILLAVLVLILITIPITLSLLQSRQDPRTRAAGSTTLSLVPQSGSQKAVGEDVLIDVMVNPGSDEVTILRLFAQFDPTKLEANTNKLFTPTDDIDIEITVKPTIISNNTVAVVLNIENPITDVIQSKTSVGTFNFKAIGETGETPTKVTLTSKTQVFSTGSNDNSQENVLTEPPTPAEITIGDGAPQGAGTKLSFLVLLHGIGIAGDTQNPTDHKLSNKDPKNRERLLTAKVYDSNDNLVSEGTGKIHYQTANKDKDLNGTFIGSVFLKDFIEDGSYTVKVETDRYLHKKFPQTITLTKNGDNQLPLIELVAGDVYGDNILNLVDYNILRDCGYAELNPLPLSNPNSQYNSNACKKHEARVHADLDDNGTINAFDYNLFIREYPIGTGD